MKGRQPPVYDGSACGMGAHLGREAVECKALTLEQNMNMVAEQVLGNLLTISAFAVDN